jgi:superfamily II DNA or RNA helicase
MADHEGTKYEHRPIICYFATKSVMCKRGYLQMPPGAGKTWVCLLTAKFWASMIKPLEAVYVVLNEGLKEQVVE